MKTILVFACVLNICRDQLIAISDIMYISFANEICKECLCWKKKPQVIKSAMANVLPFYEKLENEKNGLTFGI